MDRLPLLLGGLGLVGVVFALLSFVVAIVSDASAVGSRGDLGWIFGNFGLGVALLVAAAVLNFDAVRERLASGEARRAGKYGTNAAVSTLLGIAILGMLGFIGTRYHHRFDWSEGKIHTLSDQTKKVVEALEEDAQVLVLAPSFEQAPARALLDRYAFLSDRFQVEYADPNERPGLLETYGISADSLRQGGLVRVAVGGDALELTELDETAVTNALVKLTRTGEKTVYFIQGHGEGAIDGEAGAQRSGYVRAAEALRNENYRVESLLLAGGGGVPADADVVILAGPTRPLFDDEWTALEGYLAGGGALLVLSDARAPGDAAEKLAGWGVTLGDDIVVDRALALFGRAMTPLAGDFDLEHPITADFRDARNDPVVFHEVRSAQPGPSGNFTELVFTGESSWAERDLARLDAEGAAGIDPEDLVGPVPVMVAGTPNVSAADGTDPRLVVVGDANFASNEFLDAARNRDLFLNATNWLIGDVEAISIRPNTSRASRMELTEDEFRNIRSASLFVLPELIAVLGVFTWWSRRHPKG